MGVPDASRIGVPARLGVICLASFVVLISAAHICDERSKRKAKIDGEEVSLKCDQEYAWAVACSVISFIGSAALLVLWRTGILKDPVLPVPHGDLVTSGFFTVWWIAGVGVGTFSRPFENATGNGYFGSWVALFVSLSIAASKIPQVDQAAKTLAQSGDSLMYIWIASVVLFVQCLADWSDYDSGRARWAFAVSILSGVMATVGICMRNVIPSTPYATQGFALLLAVLWLAGWLPVTVWGPYNTMGNGYLALCTGFFYSMKTVVEQNHLLRYLGEEDGASGGANTTDFGASGVPPSTAQPTAPPADAPVQLGYPQPAGAGDYPKALGEPSTGNAAVPPPV